MVFHADMAFATEFIALAVGTALLVWSGSKENICGKELAKIVAYFTIVASLLTMLCTGYYSMRYWEDGYFRKPFHGKEAGECPYLRERLHKEGMRRHGEGMMMPGGDMMKNQAMPHPMRRGEMPEE